MSRAHQTGIVSDSLLVLGESRFVNPDARVSPVSVFSNPIWKMKGLVTLPGVHGSHAIDFTKIAGFPNGFALSFAEYIYARLHNPIPSEHEVEWLTVYNELTALGIVARHFSRRGLKDVSQIKASDWKSLLAMLQSKDSGLSKSWVEKIVGSCYRLWSFRARLSSPLLDMPFGKPFKELIKPIGSTSRDNKTPVIPSVVYGAVMTNALEYVLKHSRAILDAWLEVKSMWRVIDLAGRSKSTKDKHLAIQAAHLLAKIPSSWLPMQWSTIEELLDEVYQLRNAAVIVILAVSGIRTSELLSIQFGCCVEDILPSGEKVWCLNTTLHKHRKGGVKDAWVVIEEVVKAVAVLEELMVFVREISGSTYLLMNNGARPFNITEVIKGKKYRRYTSASIIYQMNKFAKHCGDVLGRPLPLIQNKSGKMAVWHFSARQFRRTLAHHIVRQPFGMIAGMIHYKHVGVTVFEGYAGQEPEWNKLLESEETLYDIDILGEIAIDLASGNIAGGFSKEVYEDFNSEFQGQAGDIQPSVIAKWLEGRARRIYVGKFNLCLFQPEKALCTSKSEDTVKPVLNACQPGKCGNACVRKENIPMWEAQLEQTKDFRKNFRLNKIQKKVFDDEIALLEGAMMLAKVCA